MTNRVRMARKRLMVADERFWKAWLRSERINPPPLVWVAMDDPKVKRRDRQLTSIERRKDRIA